MFPSLALHRPALPDDRWGRQAAAPAPYQSLIVSRTRDVITDGLSPIANTAECFRLDETRARAAAKSTSGAGEAPWTHMGAWRTCRGRLAAGAPGRERRVRSVRPRGGDTERGEEGAAAFSRPRTQPPHGRRAGETRAREAEDRLARARESGGRAVAARPLAPGSDCAFGGSARAALPSLAAKPACLGGGPSRDFRHRAVPPREGPKLRLNPPVCPLPKSRIS
jgi:hypothetical protein